MIASKAHWTVGKLRFSNEMPQLRPFYVQSSRMISTSFWRVGGLKQIRYWMRLECDAQSWAWKSARQYALVTSGQFSAMTQPFLIKISHLCHRAHLVNHLD